MRDVGENRGAAQVPPALTDDAGWPAATNSVSRALRNAAHGLRYCLGNHVPNGDPLVPKLMRNLRAAEENVEPANGLLEALRDLLAMESGGLHEHMKLHERFKDKKGVTLPWARVRAKVRDSARKAIVAAESPAEVAATAGAACAECGLPYGDPGFADLVVSNDAWTKISPTKDEGGLLCPSCMCGRAAKLGLSCAAVFRSGPFAPSPLSESLPEKREGT